MAYIRKEKRTKVKQRRFNGWRRLLAGSLLPLALLVVLTVSQVHPGLAQAQKSSGGGGGGGASCPGCSIVVASSGQLLARTTVLISATAICTVPAGFTFQNGFGGVGITQASGRQIVQGFGNFNLTTCDGTAQTFQVAVTLFPPSAPFHGGPATATGELIVNFLDALGNSVQAQVFTSPQVIRIRG